MILGSAGNALGGSPRSDWMASGTGVAESGAPQLGVEQPIGHRQQEGGREPGQRNVFVTLLREHVAASTTDSTNAAQGVEPQSSAHDCCSHPAEKPVLTGLTVAILALLSESSPTGPSMSAGEVATEAGDGAEPNQLGEAASPTTDAEAETAVDDLGSAAVELASITSLSLATARLDEVCWNCDGLSAVNSTENPSAAAKTESEPSDVAPGESFPVESDGSTATGEMVKHWYARPGTASAELPNRIGGAAAARGLPSTGQGVVGGYGDGRRLLRNLGAGAEVTAGGRGAGDTISSSTALSNLTGELADAELGSSVSAAEGELGETLAASGSSARGAAASSELESRGAQLSSANGSNETVSGASSTQQESRRAAHPRDIGSASELDAHRRSADSLAASRVENANGQASDLAEALSLRRSSSLRSQLGDSAGAGGQVSGTVTGTSSAASQADPRAASASASRDLSAMASVDSLASSAGQAEGQAFAQNSGQSNGQQSQSNTGSWFTTGMMSRTSGAPANAIGPNGLNAGSEFLGETQLGEGESISTTNAGVRDMANSGAMPSSWLSLWEGVSGRNTLSAGALTGAQFTSAVAEVIKEVWQQHSPIVQQVEVTVEPPDLGKIRLQFIDQQGVISARIMADTPLVQQQLQSGFEQLQSALAAVGIHLKSAETGGGRDEGRSRGQAERNERLEAIRSQRSGSRSRTTNSTPLAQPPRGAGIDVRV